MLSANSHIISASHESEEHKKFNPGLWRQGNMLNTMRWVLRVQITTEEDKIIHFEAKVPISWQRTQNSNEVHGISDMVNEVQHIQSIWLAIGWVEWWNNVWSWTISRPFQEEDMLSANNHVISASHESENYKKFVWDYEGKETFWKW